MEKCIKKNVKKARVSLVFLCMMGMLLISGCYSKYELQNTNSGNAADNESNGDTNENPAGETELTLYYGNDNADAIISSGVIIENLTPENIIRELADKAVVSADTQVNSLIKDEKDGKVSLQLDLSGEFKEYVLMMGSAEEYLAVGSLVNTFLEAYEAESILITVEGEIFESAHQSYENYLFFYPASLTRRQEHEIFETIINHSYHKLCGRNLVCSIAPAYTGEYLWIVDSILFAVIPCY